MSNIQYIIVGDILTLENPPLSPTARKLLARTTR